MAIQEQVLEAALRICSSRKGWTFRPAEIVAALPHLNAGSVRTHVMSRCCVNAPPNHAHRRAYFRRLTRGVYEIIRAERRHVAPEQAPRYGARDEPAAASGIWVEIRESAGHYIARAGRFPVRVDSVVGVPDPVFEAYERDVDRSSIRRNLRLTPEQRLIELQQWIDAVEEIRGAASQSNDTRPKPGP